ncbi:MAG TPA: hypothetical protein VM450_17145 [Thermomicrobiales bacterium]|nr:hypothetical protein [Thermomicrobiales bacterium]
MGSADTNAPAGTGIPAPTKGVGAAELTTASNDPAVLRELLDRARERLAFYESFDRIIGENIRRSGELMVETVALREQAQAQAAQFAAERAEFETTRRDDREKYRHLVQTALNDVAAARPLIDQLVERLQEALVGFGEEPGEGVATEPPAMPEAAVEVTSETVAAMTTPAPELTPEPPLEVETGPDATSETPDTIEPTAPATAEDAGLVAGRRTVELLAHGVGTAAIAISLQRTLRDLEQVSSVEAREFANGVLRLQVEADGPIGAADITEWLEKHEGQVANASDRVLEINLGTAPAT